MLERFYEFLEHIGVSQTDVYTQKENDTTLVSFAQVTDSETNLIVSLVFYDESERVEIYVATESEDAESLTILQKLNQLNMAYSGIVFFASEDSVALKIFLEGNFELDDLIAKVMLAISVADNELQNF